MLDTNKLIVEATSANIFVMKNDCWYTPSLDQCGVSGVMRKHVLSTMHKYNIDVEIGNVHLDTLRNAQSVFLTNAIAVIIPVTHLYLHNNHENCIKLDNANNNDLCKLISVINSKAANSEHSPS